MIGASTACFYPMYTENALKILNEIGFKKVEVFFEAYAESSIEFCSKIKEYSLENEIEIVSVHGLSTFYEPFLFDVYERRRKDSLKIFEEFIKGASLMGAKYYTFHGNRKNEENLPSKRDINCMKEILNVANEYGVALAWENVSWCQSSGCEYIKGMLEHIENLYFTLDIKQAHKANNSVFDYINVMKDRIVNVHINDYDSENSCLLPGRGAANIYDIIKKLRENGYKNNFIIEVYSDNFSDNKDLLASKEHLNDILERIKNEF